MFDSFALALLLVCPAQDPDVRSTPDDDAELRAFVAEVAAELAERRGLEGSGDVAVRLVTPAAFRDAVKSQVRRNLPENYVAQIPAVLELFGQIPDAENFDLVEIAVESMVADMIGLYLPGESTMCVVEHPEHTLARLVGSEELRRQVLVHEVHHALQDSAFDLARFIGNPTATYDRRVASSAFVEGDAVLTATDHFMRLGGSSALEYDGDVGEEVRRNIDIAAVTNVISTGVLGDTTFHAFAYGGGASFAQALLRAGGWSALNAAFADPPTSSEQILHPSKYLGPRDRPVTVEFDVPSEVRELGWEPLHGDVLGEFFLGALVADAVAPELAIEAPVGWDGDRCLLVGNGERRALAWSLAFDSTRDAQQAAEALTAVFEIGEYDARTERLRRGSGRDAVALERRRDRLVLLLGVDAELEDAWLRAAFDAPVVHDPLDVSKGRDDARTTREIERVALEALAAKAVRFDGTNAVFTELDLRLVFPSDRWSREEPPVPTLVAMFHRGTPQVNLNVLALADGGLDLEDQLALNVEQIRTIVQDLELLSDEIVDVGAERAVDLLWLGHLNGNQVACHQRIHVRGGKQIVLTCTCVGRDFTEEIASEFRATLDSVRFGPDEAAPPTTGAGGRIGDGKR